MEALEGYLTVFHDEDCPECIELLNLLNMVGLQYHTIPCSGMPRAKLGLHNSPCRIEGLEKIQELLANGTFTDCLAPRETRHERKRKMKTVEPEIHNAEICSTQLGDLGRGFTALVNVKWQEHYHAGFGALALDRVDGASRFVQEICEVLGVHTWEDVSGNYCRIKYDPLEKTVTAIGHITEPKWFTLKKFQQESLSR